MIPALTVQRQGLGVITADNANTYLQVCQNLAQLRTFTAIDGMQVYAQGIASPDDGGQGNFFWNPASTAPDDNLNTIVPQGAASGAWNRLIEGGGSSAPISCTATGTNVYLLTPVAGSAVSAYVNYQMYLWVAPNSSTGLVTANVASLGALPVYLGGSQAGAGGISAGTLYVLAYVSSLAGGALVVVSPSTSTGGVTNSQLAPMAEYTIKGNDTATTATPQDLSETQVTAMLNAFGGDSGLGGVKGLVPAPPSGSGASGFVLLANGTWGSSGGSSSVTTNGYVTIGDLIFQWGFYNAAVPNGTLFTITWPKPFTTAVFGCQATLINPSDVQSTATGIQVSGTPTTTSGVFWSTGYQSGSTSSLSGFYWLAYGM